jgi:hypothetical protein
MVNQCLSVADEARPVFLVAQIGTGVLMQVSPPDSVLDCGCGEGCTGLVVYFTEFREVARQQRS